MKKALSIILAILTLLSVTLCASAEGESEYVYPTSGVCGIDGDNLVWSRDENGKVTISGKGDMQNYGRFWPSESSPFDGLGDLVKEVEIRSGVTSVGDMAFADCSKLRRVQFPNTLRSIGTYAFEDNELTEVALPDSLETIGQTAFYHCLNLMSFSVSKKCKGFSVKDGVLFTKDGTELVQYPIGNTRRDYTVPDGVKTLRTGSFYKAKELVSVSLPDSLEEIGQFAFEHCFLLRSVQMPKTLREFGWSAFNSCSMLGSIVVPEGVRIIYDNTFNGCSLLRSVTLPSTLETIEHDAFYACNLLNDIYYNGTADQWDHLNIQGQSTNFYMAHMHFKDAPSGGLLQRIMTTIRNYFHAMRRYFEEFFKLLQGRSVNA